MKPVRLNFSVTLQRDINGNYNIVDDTCKKFHYFAKLDLRNFMALDIIHSSVYLLVITNLHFGPSIIAHAAGDVEDPINSKPLTENIKTLNSSITEPSQQTQNLSKVQIIETTAITPQKILPNTSTMPRGILKPAKTAIKMNTAEASAVFNEGYLEIYS